MRAIGIALGTGFTLGLLLGCGAPADRAGDAQSTEELAPMLEISGELELPDVAAPPEETREELEE